MSDFTDFPNDDRRWFIRHIDGFIKPHKGTSSTSVQCELAPIPEAWDDPAKLKPRQISDLFGDGNQEVFLTTLFVGAVSAYVTGMVFKCRAYVGSLPARQLDLRDALRLGEASGLYKEDPKTGQQRAVRAETLLGTSPKGYPLKVLASRQLKLTPKTRASTQFLVVRDTSDPIPSNHIEFIIPRLVIYRTYYGFSSKVAEIFSSGQWDVVYTDAVYEEEFAGNKTGVNPETGAWDIVLALGMTLEDAPKIALLYFDPYARKQANRLYIPMSRAREQVQLNASDDAHWYTNAHLPLDPAGMPYCGTVSGYFLDSRRDGHFPGKTFLVRAIHSMNMPHGMPPVGGTIVNDNTDGAHQTESDGPRPFGGRQRNRKKRPNTTPSVDTHDGSNRKPSFALPSISFVIDPPHHAYRLKKDKSVIYTGPRTPPTEEPTQEGSAGNTNGNQESKSHLHSAQLSREPSALFEGLMSAMNWLQDEGKISDFHIIQPSDSYQRVSVGAYDCWNFLLDEQRTQQRDGRAKLPTRLWPYIASGRTVSSAVERAALVLCVDLPNGLRGMWFEIETRPSESFTSAFVIDRGTGIPREVATALSIIRKAKGVSLTKHFRLNNIDCHCHAHYMDKTDKSKWSTGPLVAFFGKLSKAPAAQ